MKRIGGFKIATIRGVDIKLHVSLLFILFYIVLVASARFPSVVEEAGLNAASVFGGPLLWGVIFAVALFTSVLLHELGHVFVAQSMGVHVRGITLMMLGGVSEMGSMPQKRFQEFKVSIIGPIVSFAIAGGLFALKYFIEEPNVALFSYWLGRVNLVLGIFNLLPAFPMDGGRVLRSLISARHGNLRATQISVKIGKGFALVFAIIGFLQFNILLMLIAAFLYVAATSELALVEGKRMLREVKARDVAKRVEPLRDNLAVEAAAREMVRSHNLVLPVLTRNGEAALIGIESIRGLPSEKRYEILVSDVMEKVERILDADDQIDDILPELAANPFRALPYREMGKIVGLVRYSDLSELLLLRSLNKSHEEDTRRAA